MKTYLLYVRKYDMSINDYALKVYKTTTSNVYRVIGKIYCTSIEAIKRIDYAEYTEKRRDFWEKNHFEIVEYVEPRLSEDLECEAGTYKTANGGTINHEQRRL